MTYGDVRYEAMKNSKNDVMEISSLFRSSLKWSMNGFRSLWALSMLVAISRPSMYSVYCESKLSATLFCEKTLFHTSIYLWSIIP